MSLLQQVERGRQTKPRRVMLYGVHGVGKSSWGASAPQPVFVQTEDGLANIDCAKFPLAESFDDVMAALMELYSDQHEFQTVVIVGHPGLSIEVKRRERFNLEAALEKAAADAAEEIIPLVLHRRNHRPWLVTLELDNLPELVVRLFHTLANKSL